MQDWLIKVLLLLNILRNGYIKCWRFSLPDSGLKVLQFFFFFFVTCLWQSRKRWTEYGVFRKVSLLKIKFCKNIFNILLNENSDSAWSEWFCILTRIRIFITEYSYAYENWSSWSLLSPLLSCWNCLRTFYINMNALYIHWIHPNTIFNTFFDRRNFYNKIFSWYFHSYKHALHAKIIKAQRRKCMFCYCFLHAINLLVNFLHPQGKWGWLITFYLYLLHFI